MQKRNKWIYAVVALVLAAAVAVGIVLFIQHDNKEEQLQKQALTELERNVGQYDPQSIVLNNTSKAKAEKLARLYGAKLRITEDGHFATLTLPEGTTIRDVYAMDESLKHIEEMAPDYQVKVSELNEEEASGEKLPQRPQYSVSDENYELQTYLDYLNMGTAWEKHKGTGVTIAVIDTGIDTDHPEFAGRISEYSYNATEDKVVKDWNHDWSLIEDEVGHGTAVTGVLAAAMDGNGIVGIAPYVEIVVIKAECNEYGQFKRTSDLVYGIYYAIERNVQVINMSFGTDINAFAEATQLAYDSDIVCVAAAGNDSSSSLSWPAADENVIGVGALDGGWVLADYSNYGENTDLVAPGSTYTTLVGGTYGTMNGTSLAAPIVAGAIALHMQKNRYTTFDKVTEILYASCYDLGDLGRDWYYGFGALDISAFLLEERGTITYDLLTDELENMEGLYIQGHTLQELPEPERLYAVFDGWYYDDTFTHEYGYYEDKFYGDEITLYAKWANEDDGVPYTYVILDDGTVEILSYTGHRRYITIPEKIEERTVSSIGDFAFAGQTRLREVTLPSGLTHIGVHAFENCANLVSIQIPECVREIEEYAFYGNVRLSTVAFRSNSNLETIGDYTFANCGKLARIDLPATLKSMNGSAFFGATAMQSITVQRGNAAFQSKDGVLFDVGGSTLVVFPAAWGTEYTIPAETTTIGTHAFAYAGLRQIDLANVTTIGSLAFPHASLEVLAIPDSVTSMGAETFFKNSNLSQLTIGRGLSNIPARAFCDTALTTLEIPNNIESLSAEAFASSNLQRVTFEENSALTNIGSMAFSGCYISEISIPASVSQIGIAAFLSNPLVRVDFAENSVLQTISSSAFAECWQLKTVTLPASLQEIGCQAFMSTALLEVTIPAGVTSLGDGAFACCMDLFAITVESGNAVYHDIDGVVYNLDNSTVHAFPAGKEMEAYATEHTVRAIAPWAFAGAWRVNTVILPEGLTQIGSYGFYLSGVRNYSLPSTVTHIMDHAFEKNKNLTTIALPESLVQIAEYAFSTCSNLQSIQIPDNVRQLGRYVFANDWNLRTISFSESSKLPRLSYGAFAYCGIISFRVPANVSTMAQSVFEECPNLSSITFAKDSKLESIPAYLFDGCNNLQSITFEQGSALTNIQAHGLEGMGKLTTVNFGDAKVTNVGNFAFRFCENLSVLDLPKTVTSIGRYAFYGCNSLTELTIPEKVEHIGSYAFQGTGDAQLYFAKDVLPTYLDENWDHGIRGYYTGVVSVKENGEYKYATLTSGDIAILEYLGDAAYVDLAATDLGADIVIIGGSAFEGSTAQIVVLPETLTAIQAEAFAYSNLTAITIPANVTFIGREAFAHTDIHTLVFAADSKLSVVEQKAFMGTESLSEVTLPASLTTMGTGVFLQSGLTSVSFADGIQITEIPQQAFANTKLEAVALPNSVTLVNHNAFNNVRTLRCVSFGDNDGIRLMSNAFYRTGLETLHIPANVTYIGEYCFVALPNLTEITADEGNPNYKVVDGLLLNKSGRKLIIVPAGRTGVLTVPEGVEEIGFGAFEKSKLSHVQFLPDANILTLGNRAFFEAENITTITIPKSVVSIDYYAFAYCENLKEVVFAKDNQIKGVYEGAFIGCINLEHITLPDSVVEISDFAFFGCTKVTRLPISENNNIKGIYDYAFAYTGFSGEFTAPETLWDIGDYAFQGTKLTKVTIPDTGKKELMIGIGAFEGCNKLTEITVPFIGAGFEDEKLSWFGYIFGAGSYEANETYVPASLKTVTITEGITNIYTGGFAYCTGLDTINVPHSVTGIWTDAFVGTGATYTLTNTITTYAEDGDTLLVKQGHFGTGIEGSVRLSERVKGISRYAFLNCYDLTGVNIPEGVEIIEQGAFYNCGSLRDVVIPNSVKTIGDYAFACTYLGELVIPEGVTEIAGYAFYGCSGLSSVTIPESLEVIGGAAFYDCQQLYEINNHGSLELSIGSEAYGYIAKHAKVIVDKEGNKTYRNDAAGFTYTDTADGFRCITENGEYVLIGYIGSEDTITLPEHIGGKSYVLRNFNGGKNVVIPEGITEIPEAAFMNSGTLRSITIPDSVTKIGNAAFRDCRGLTTVSYGNRLKTIGQSAFSGCDSLTTITIPEGVETIGNNAFSNCDKVDSIFIPGSVRAIHGFAFSYTIVKNVYIQDLPAWCGISFENEESNPMDCSENLYINGELVRELTIPGNVTTIAPYAFEGCRSLEKVVMSNGVQRVENSAFRDCENIEQVEFPSSMTAVDAYAFYGCTKIKQLTVTKNISEIGGNAFPESAEILYEEGNSSFCKSGGILYNADLTTVIRADRTISGDIVLPDSVKTINSHAFYNCANITSITIPHGVNEIQEKTFAGCSNLTNVSLPETICVLGEEAFSGCKNLYSIQIPDSVWCLDRDVFKDCSSLRQLNLSENVRTFYHSTGCTSLERIDFAESNPYYTSKDGIVYRLQQRPSGPTWIINAVPLNVSGRVEILESVKTLEVGVFENCMNLEEIVIPEGVTEIPFVAFARCYSLREVVLPESLKTIGGGAFSECANLMQLTIPENVTGIDSGAFYECVKLYEIHNKSELSLEMGSEDHGNVAYFAKTMVDKNGNREYKAGVSAFSYLDTDDGYRFVCENGEYTLIAYLGDEECITLPANINGKPYKLLYFNGAKKVCFPEGVTNVNSSAFTYSGMLESVIIPEGVTQIGSQAFMYCRNLKEVSLPDSLENIGLSGFWMCTALKSIVLPENLYVVQDSAFGSTGLVSIRIPGGCQIAPYAFSGCSDLECVTIEEGIKTIGSYAFSGCTALRDLTIPDSMVTIRENAFSSTWLTMYAPRENGLMLVDGWLLAVDEDLEHIGDYKKISKAINGVYEEAYKLQDAVLATGLPSNAVTVYITCIDEGTPFLQNTTALKNVIICDTVSASDLHYCQRLFTAQNVTGVTIYVEFLEEDVRWDDNFPGWNNGNTVLYEDQWSFANFYDENGELISSEPRRNSKVIRRPIYSAPEATATWFYEFLGWDLDNDGVADMVPATTDVDIHAKAVVVATNRCEASGHLFTSYISDGNATTEKDGTKTAHCDRGCGATDTIPDEGSRLPASIASNVYTISNGYLSKVAAGTTVQKLLQGLEGQQLQVVKNGAVVAATGKVGTGMVVQLVSGGKVVDELTIVVTGDTNGDGSISVTDMIAVKAHVLKKTLLNGASEKAADTNGDKKISVTDFIQIKAQILGKSQIQPAAVESAPAEVSFVTDREKTTEHVKNPDTSYVIVFVKKPISSVPALLKQKETIV